jgi:hypothetical protein
MGVERAGSYASTWVPRIGEEAIPFARRDRALTAAVRFGALALSVGFVASLRAGIPIVAVGCLAVGGAILVGWIGNRRRLAAALSRHLGVSLNWFNVPQVISPQRFDVWSQRTQH